MNTQQYEQLQDKIRNLENELRNIKNTVESLRCDREYNKQKLREFDELKNRISNISLESTIWRLGQRIDELEKAYSDKTTNDQVKEYIQKYFDNTSIDLLEQIN